MIDRATHWFYAERQVSVGAAVENMRHDFWANGFYNVWLSVSRREARRRIESHPRRPQELTLRTLLRVGRVQRFELLAA